MDDTDINLSRSINPCHTFAFDFFKQDSVGLAAERVVDQCLVNGLTGLDWPSAEQHVYAKIVRTDAPFDLLSLGKINVQNMSLPNATTILQMATGFGPTFLA